ncbi:MAG: DivIVA domain-containing protein, partial [Mycobacteriales bacterium]
EAPVDAADLGLPVGPLQPEDVPEIRLGLAFRGYRMSEVDDVLDRVGVELAARDARIRELERALADVVEPHVAALEREQAGAVPVAAAAPAPEPAPGAVAAEPDEDAEPEQVVAAQAELGLPDEPAEDVTPLAAPAPAAPAAGVPPEPAPVPAAEPGLPTGPAVEPVAASGPAVEPGLPTGPGTEPVLAPATDPGTATAEPASAEPLPAADEQAQPDGLAEAELGQALEQPAPVVSEDAAADSWPEASWLAPSGTASAPGAAATAPAGDELFPEVLPPEVADEDLPDAADQGPAEGRR